MWTEKDKKIYEKRLFRREIGGDKKGKWLMRKGSNSRGNISGLLPLTIKAFIAIKIQAPIGYKSISQASFCTFLTSPS